MFTLRGALLAAITCVAVVAAPAAAAKPGASTPASITLNQTAPKVGDPINFTVTYPRTSANPLVRVRCFQGDAYVYHAVSYPTATFWLTSPGWTGAATCTADLYYHTYSGKTQTGVVYLATTTFDVGG